MDFNSFAAAAASEDVASGYTNLPHTGWGWYEVWMGFVVGVYPVIAARSRDFDCWSRHIQFGMRFVDWHYYFDGAFDVT